MLKYYDKSTECMKKSEMEVLQSERLIALVKHVYANVRFYKDKMDALKLKPSDIKTIKDIVKLPFTEKSDLRDTYPFGLLAIAKTNVVRFHASSGTTGKMTVIGYSQKDIDVWSEAMARSLTCAGVNEDSTVHIAYGYGMFTGGLGVHYGAEKLGATVLPVSSGNTARQIMLLQDLEATTLCCTPSYAAYISDSIQKNGLNIKDFSLKRGVFGAEPWTGEMRKKIEMGLNIKAYDIYGLSEISGPGVSMECGEQNGLHVWEDFFYPEILDDNLNQVQDNIEGELVFTTLCKEAMPLLRYRTSDICSLNRDVCKCGRTHVRMGKLKGRKDDMLIVRGINVFPSQIETVLLQNGSVSPHYQIKLWRENNIDVLEVKVELLPTMFSDEVKKIEAIRSDLEYRIYSTLGISAKVRFVEPNSIPRSEGKAVRVIDKR